MGTSSSNKGPESGVPFVPPWIPNPYAPAGQNNSPVNHLAPAKRFKDARRLLGGFSRSGDRSKLGKGLGYYVLLGLGGSKMATQRMGRVAELSGALYDALKYFDWSNFISPAEIGIDAESLAEYLAEIIDRIVQSICPNDGTQDAELSRDAIDRTLSDLLKEDEQADISSLTNEQIEWVIGRYIACEIYQRIVLDAGENTWRKAPSISAGMDRQDEMRNCIEEKVAAAFRTQHRNGKSLTREKVQQLATQVMQATFERLEEYIQ